MVTKRSCLTAALTVLLGAALLASPADAQQKKLEPTGTWKGSVESLALLKEAPPGGYLGDEKALAKLWEAWKVKGKPPRVDFTKELLLVGTTRGSVLNLRPLLDEKGNLTFPGLATRDLRPGFRYQILQIGREGVKTINGKEPSGG